MCVILFQGYNLPLILFQTNPSTMSLEEEPPLGVKNNMTTLQQRQNFMSNFVAKIELPQRGTDDILDKIVTSCASAVMATGRCLYLTCENSQHIWR